MGGAHSERKDFAKSARRDVIYPFHMKEKNRSTVNLLGGSWGGGGGGGVEAPPPPPPPPPPDRTLAMGSTTYEAWLSRY